MKREDIKKSFDKVDPNDKSTYKMLNNILNNTESKKKVGFMEQFKMRKVVPAAAMVCVLAISVFSYNFFSRDTDGVQRGIRTDNLTGTDMIGREDMAIEIRDQFQIGNKHYLLLSEWYMEQFNLPSTIAESDIGSKITTITTSIDSSLIGLDVYEYIPAGGEAIVALKTDSGYQLYKFFNFESYNNNKDEDVEAYLKLFGINSPSDIAKIQFIGHGELAKIRGQLDIRGELTDIDSITQFYNYYSVIKDSSDKYFEKLFNYRMKDMGNIPTVPSDPSDPSIIPPDYDGGSSDATRPAPGDIATSDEGYDAEDLPLIGTTPLPADRVPRGDIAVPPPVEPKPTYDRGEQGQSTEPSQGSAGNALFDSVTIRIYNQNGIYFETQYYPNMGFISRHEVSSEFAAFLENHM